MRLSLGRSTPAIRAIMIFLLPFGCVLYQRDAKNEHTRAEGNESWRCLFGILADDHDTAFALDNLAFFADLFNRRSDFHKKNHVLFPESRRSQGRACNRIQMYPPSKGNTAISLDEMPHCGIISSFAT